MAKVTIESTVQVHYTGRLEDGSIFDTSLVEGRDPLKATLGQGQLIPGFEEGLVGMELNEKKTIIIESEKAYGDIRQDFITEVPRNLIPEDAVVGSLLQAQGPNGVFNVMVQEIKEEVAVLDANHPLAGKTLIFELEVIDIQ